MRHARARAGAAVVNPDAIAFPLIDTFTLDAGELRALQKRAARRHGLPAVSFRDPGRDPAALPELVVIPAGSFEYGAGPEEDAPTHELPRRRAQIERDFAIGMYPVTAQEFEHYAAATSWRRRAELVWLSGRKPAINVRPDDARAYCAWLSQETGRFYRLPTEQEWEYACRAGAASAYPLGDRITPSGALYNPRQDATDRGGTPGWPWLVSRLFPRGRVAPGGAQDVGLLPPNRWGLHDIIGNVWEFTASPWTRDHASPPERPLPGRQQGIVTKGGSWFDGARDCRCAARRRRLDNELDVNLGFRVVREL